MPLFRHSLFCSLLVTVLSCRSMRTVVFGSGFKTVAAKRFGNTLQAMSALSRRISARLKGLQTFFHRTYLPPCSCPPPPHLFTSQANLIFRGHSYRAPLYTQAPVGPKLQCYPGRLCLLPPQCHQQKKANQAFLPNLEALAPGATSILFIIAKVITSQWGWSGAFPAQKGLWRGSDLQGMALVAVLYARLSRRRLLRLRSQWSTSGSEVEIDCCRRRGRAWGGDFPAR